MQSWKCCPWIRAGAWRLLRLHGGSPLSLFDLERLVCLSTRLLEELMFDMRCAICALSLHACHLTR
jgi:hypothetical protein